MNLTDQQIKAAMEALGFVQEDFEVAVRDQILLEDLKALAKTRFRKVALALHPDKTGGDATKTELFHAVSKVYDDIKELRPIPVLVQRAIKWAVKINMERV